MPSDAADLLLKQNQEGKQECEDKGERSLASSFVQKEKSCPQKHHMAGC